MTSGSTTTGDPRATGGTTRPVRRTGGRGAAGWAAAVIAAALLPGFTALPQPAAAAPVHSGPAGYHLYAHGFMSDGLVGYNVTDSTRPQPIPGQAESGMGSWPQTASPDGRLLYVASGAMPRLLPYAIAPDGRLRALGSPLALPDVPVDIVFAPDGRHAYVLMGVLNASILPLRIGADGIPVPDGPAVPFGSALDGVSSATISPDGRSLYAASYLMNQLVRFAIHPDGSVSPALQRIPTDVGPIYPTITPDGRHLYLSNERSADVNGYDIAPDGSLSPVPGSPFRAGLLPHVMSITPDGRHVYVPNMGSSFISAYTVRPDGALRSLPDAQFGNGLAGPKSEATVMSPSGKVLWAFGTDPSQIGLNSLRRYSIGPDGVLVPDDTTVIDTGTRVADGRTLTLAPGR